MRQGGRRCRPSRRGATLAASPQQRYCLRVQISASPVSREGQWPQGHAGWAGPPTEASQRITEGLSCTPTKRSVPVAAGARGRFVARRVRRAAAVVTRGVAAAADRKRDRGQTCHQKSQSPPCPHLNLLLPGSAVTHAYALLAARVQRNGGGGLFAEPGAADAGQRVLEVFEAFFAAALVGFLGPGEFFLE